MYQKRQLGFVIEFEERERRGQIIFISQRQSSWRTDKSKIADTTKSVPVLVSFDSVRLDWIGMADHYTALQLL